MQGDANLYDGDYIPAHYKVGDALQISADGGNPFECEILETTLVSAVARSKVGQCYLIDYQSSKITQLNEWDRCPNCGRHLCSCNQPENQTMSDIKPIPLEQLDEYIDNQPINQVEGVLKAIWEPKDVGKYPRQNGYLKDDAGTEHRICFAVEDVFQDLSKKGKRMRITCKFGKTPTGVKMKLEADGKYRKIWVTGTAKIEWPDAGNAPSSGGGGRSEYSGNGGDVAGSQSHTKRRIFNYLTVLEEVRQGWAACLEKGMDLPAEPTDEDHRAVATTIFLSFKGKYGVYADPIFPKGNEPAQSTEPAREVETELDGKEGWRDFVHPQNDETLGDIFESDEDRIMDLIQWAHATAAPKEVAIKNLRLAVLEAAKELNVTAKTALQMRVISKIGTIDPTLTGVLNEYFKNERGVSWSELDDDDSEAALKNKKTIPALQKAFSKAQEDEEEEEEEVPS